MDLEDYWPYQGASDCPCHVWDCPLERLATHISHRGSFPSFTSFLVKVGKVRGHQGVVQELSEMTYTAAGGIPGQKITKSFNLQHYIQKRFSKNRTNSLTLKWKQPFWGDGAPPCWIIGAMAFAGVVFFAHYRITSGQISTGDFVSFIAALALLMDPIRKYSQANVKLNQARAAGQRIFDIIALPEEEDQGLLTPKTLNHSIEFKNVSFSSGEGNGDVLKNVSFTLKKGEKVGLVGLSGSGKSTLINLLLSLYPVERGEILVDGSPLSQIKIESLRSLFALVSQDIFSSTTLSKKPYLKPTTTYQNIDAALKVALCQRGC